MPQERTRKIVITGIMSAIAIFLGVTRLGYITWGAASLTIMHIPVIIGAILEGPIVGLLIGLIFGVTSMIQAAVAPNGPADVIFINPLIAVVPRLFIGPVAWLIWTAIKRWPPVGLILSGAIGSLTNSVLVLGAIGIVGSLGNPAVVSILGANPWPVLIGIFGTNSIPEIILSAVAVAVLVGAWMGINLSRRKGANLG
jgi:uncharacterized membrane protein